MSGNASPEAVQAKEATRWEKPPPRFFWAAPFWRAMLETWLTGGLLFAGLLLLRNQQLIIQVLPQGVFFLSAAAALYDALRLQLPQGSRSRRILLETLSALALAGAITAGWIGLAYLMGAGDLLDSRFAFLTIPMLLLCSGPAFLPFRLGVWLWHFWDRLRRRRLIWAFTHTQLQLVLAVIALFILVSSVVLVQTAAVDHPIEPSTGPAAVVARLVHTVFPYLSIALVITILALAFLLPPTALIAYLLARRTTRRLERLAQAVASLRKGDYSARSEVQGEDEIARLQADFNATADTLTQTMVELQAERDKVTTLLKNRRELLAGVSHELRTPVATLRGYLESGLSGWQGNTPPATLRRDLEVMEREVVQLQRLIDDLFTLARAQVQNLALTLQATAVGPIIEQRVQAIAPLAWQQHRVEVVAQVPSDLPPVLVDAGRLDQILANLLHNAIRHTPPGGIVVAGAAAGKDTIHVEVRDTGEGIPPKDLPHIWERFYRHEPAEEDDSGRAGLGLTLVKALAEAMGGSVEVESVLGEGSCFRVHLPQA